MTFSGDLRAFAAKVEARQKDVFVGCVNTVRNSVVDGSAITGAPGQPVDTGYLKGSWRQEYPEQWVGSVLSYDAAYAEAIEEGQGKYGPMTLRSEVGGFHSVKQTRAGWQNIVDSVVQEVVRD
jgi:hypothetical protein